MQDKLEGEDDYLKWHDKYGKNEEDEKPWNIDDVAEEVVERIRKFVGKDIGGESDKKSLSSSVEEAKSNQRNRAIKRVYLFSAVERLLEKEKKENRQYYDDIRQMVKRTLTWMQNVGLASSVKDVETLVVQSKIRNSTNVNVQGKLEELEWSRRNIDAATSNMVRQRESLQSIMDSIQSAQDKIRELKD